MVSHGEQNTRFKDFFDVWTLSSRFSFDGATISAAIQATFSRRKTATTDPRPHALAPAFYADPGRRDLWMRYIKRAKLASAPADFAAVGERATGFFGPPWARSAVRAAARLLRGRQAQEVEQLAQPALRPAVAAQPRPAPVASPGPPAARVPTIRTPSVSSYSRATDRARRAPDAARALVAAEAVALAVAALCGGRSTCA